MRRVTFRGFGQLNGVVSINKTIELDDKTASSLTGPKRNEVKLAILAIHYPGVKIDPKNIGIESVYFNERNITNRNEKNTKKEGLNNNTSFSLFSILKFFIFLPFKIFRMFFKAIWNDRDLSSKDF
jgi:hypothetical protein